MKRVALALLWLIIPFAVAQRPALVPPVVRFYDQNGKPLSGGKLYSYQAGTTTPLATYTDPISGSLNTNPTILDSTGSAHVFLGANVYKFVLQDSHGNTQWTQDNIAQGSFQSTYVTSFTGTQGTRRTGDVTALTGDYTCAQVTGCPSLPTIYYQSVQENGTTETQRSKLNLIPGSNAGVVCIDNPGANSTDCTITSSAASIPNSVCNSNGCYRSWPDGTIEAWGVVSAPTSGGTLVNVPLTYPTTFPIAPVLNVSGGSHPSSVSFVSQAHLAGATGRHRLPLADPSLSASSTWHHQPRDGRERVFRSEANGASKPDHAQGLVFPHAERAAGRGGAWDRSQREIRAEVGEKAARKGVAN